MASRTLIELSDDLDGKKADETVTFALDGTAYEIDLSRKNAASLRKAFEPFVTAGRRSTGARGAGGGRRTGTPTRRDPEQTKAIRDWARSSGYTVSDRGRISTEIVAAYNAAPTA